MDVSSTASYSRVSDSSAPPSTSRTSVSASSSSSHALVIALPCPLLDAPNAVRSLILDYVDDLTATRCLTTCHSLYRGLHQYPLKQAMSVASFLDATQLKSYLKYNPLCIETCYFLQLLQLPFGLTFTMTRTTGVLFARILLGVVLAIVWCCLVWLLLFRRRVDCCTKSRPGLWRRRHTIPRVTRLCTELYDTRLLPYLQHLTELSIAYDKDEERFVSSNNPLPHSLRTMRLLASPDLVLLSTTLPPHLTSLSLSTLKDWRLPVGVLPASLTSLHLTEGFDMRWPIKAGVLPSSLQRLSIDEWTLPLSDIALPASLVELDIDNLADRPLLALPPQLEVLRIGGAFNQSLLGVLPASLRVLRLVGEYNQLLNLTAWAPQLEELVFKRCGSSHYRLPATCRAFCVCCDWVSDAPQ